MKQLLHNTKHLATLLTLAVLLALPGMGWGQYSGTGTFTKITSISDLSDGYYVIAYGTTYAMNNTNTASYFDRTAITTSSNTITNPAVTIVWLIQTHVDGGRTIYNENSSKYVSYTGSSNAAYAVSSVTGGSERWSFAWSSTVFTCINVTSTTRYLQYNTGSPRFACYTGSQQNLTLYKLASTATPTKLAITSISPSSPTAGSTFSVTVQAQDGSNNPANVTSATQVTLTKATGSGTFGGTLTGTIANGSNSVTISGVTYNTAETGVSLTASATSGMTLTEATSSVFTVLASLPTPSSAVTVSSRTNNSVGLSWSSGNGAGRIVVARLNSSSAVAPTAGAAYVPNSTSFSDGLNPTTGTGNVVVYNGTGNSVTVTGLSAATAYNFDVYEYNGSTSTYNYAAASSAGSTSTLSNEPTTQASAITFSSVTATGMTIGWTSGNGSNRLVLVKAGSAADALPVDGTSYNANTTFGNGTQIGTGNYVVYVSTGSSVTISGLSSNTAYYVAVFEFNGSSTTTNYLTTAPLTGSQTTIPSAATSMVTGIRTDGSINISWTNGNGTGRIVVARLSSGTSAIPPTNGNTYLPNSTSIGDPLNPTTGTGNIVVYNGTGSSATITGLTSSTNYRFDVYEYYGSNYSAALTSGAISTLYAEPTLQTSLVTFSNIGATSFTIGWTNGNGSNRIVLLKSGSSVNSDPIDGTVYTANAAFSSGSQIGTGNYVVYNGTGTSVNVTGLSANTTYYAAVYEFGGSGGNTNYLLPVPAAGNQITLVSAPSAPTNLTFNMVTSSSFKASYTAPVTAPTGYLVLRRTGSAVTGSPAGGSTYTVGGTIGTGTIVYLGTDVWNNYDQTGLADNTVYYYAVYSYNGSGTQTNYTASALTGSQITSIIPAPTATSASSITSNGFTANWDAVAGAGSYKLDASIYESFNSAGYATDLFISEYIEGTGSNEKYIEIYNGTNSDVDLSNYKLQLYQNGSSSVSQEVILTGTLAKGYTIVYKNSPSSLYTGESTVLNTVVNFNGDDAVALYKISSGTYVDIIGRIGEDPGSAWTSGSYTTADRTLVRKAAITGGVTANPVSGFPTLATEWDQYDLDTRTYLGSHSYGTPDFVAGYNNLTVNTINQAISGLATTITYYYRVRAVGGNSTSANSNAISVTTGANKISTEAGDWNSITWSPAGTPVAKDEVTINHAVTLATTADCHDLTIGTGSLTIASGGSIITSGSVSGSVTCERYMTAVTTWPGSNDGWHFLSSPVDEQSILGDWTPSGENNNYDFYAWEESNVATPWLNQKEGANGITAFVPGKGYLVAYQVQGTKEFSGILNSGDVDFNLKKSGSKSWTYTSGNNLIGNPYPSSIDWNLADRSQFQDEFAYVYNGNGYTQVDGSAVDAFIAPNQGFFVISDVNDQNFTFTDAIRVHGGSYVKSDSQDDKFIVRLSDETHSDFTTIRLREQSTPQRDRLDALKFLSFNPEMPQVYSRTSDGISVAVNSIPGNGEVQSISLPIYAPVNQTMTLSIENAEGMFGNQPVYLHDQFTGVDHNLTANPVYSFTATQGEDETRFTLHFSTVGIATPETSSIQVYTLGGRVYVNGAPVNAQLSLTDITGRLVQRTQLENSGLNTVNVGNLPHGVYVVTVNDGKHLVSHKIIL